MKSEINPEILDKVKKQPNNIKEFLFEVLELEYDKMDEKNPKLKDDYIKLINKYK